MEAMAVLCAEMQGEFQIRKTWKRMYRAGAEATASPIAGTARTGAVTRENPPRGVNDADSPTLNFVEETNFGVLRDETLQHDPELQLSSA